MCRYDLIFSDESSDKMDNAGAREQSITKDETDGLMSFNHTFLESLPRFFHYLCIS